MKRLLEQHSLIRKNFLTLLGMGLFLYFSYHLLQGERSYIRYISLQKSVSQLEQETLRLSDERKALETRVSMLRPSSINKDLLEERAGVPAPGARLDPRASAVDSARRAGRRPCLQDRRIAGSPAGGASRPDHRRPRATPRALGSILPKSREI